MFTNVVKYYSKTHSINLLQQSRLLIHSTTTTVYNNSNSNKYNNNNNINNIVTTSSELSRMKSFSIVVASTQQGGIGLNGNLPWPNLKNDMLHFKTITTEINNKENNINKLNVVIMGRKTWDSIPSKFKPLNNRINIILTRNIQLLIDNNKQYNINQYNSNVYASNNLNTALELCNSDVLSPHVADIHIIGGAQLYNEALQHKLCNIIYYTNILNNNIICDTYIQPIDRTVYDLTDISDLITENNITYQYHTYKRKYIHDEMQYINLIKHVIYNGNVRVCKC